MRPVTVILLSLVASAVTSLAQPFRIVTWQIDRLPPVKAGGTNSAGDELRFNEIANTLNGTDADVIVLHGVPDSEGAKKIAGLIKSKKYSVAHHAVFRHGGARGNTVGQPVAILSRREKMAGKSIEWSQTGRIEMPGGFAFGVFRHGQTAICIYAASLPGSLTNGISPADGKYYARKRNYAAQFLAHHVNWMATTFTNPLVAAYLSGDFQTAPKGPVSDECAKIFDGAGFRALAPGVVTDKSTTSITNSSELDRVQDPVFTKGVEFIASRQVSRPPPEHPIVVCDLTFKPPGATAKAAVKPPVARPAAKNLNPAPEPEPLPPPAPVVATAIPPAKQTSGAAIFTTLSDRPSDAPSQALAASVALTSASSLPAGPDRRWVWWTSAGALGAAIAAAIVRRRTVRREEPTATKQVTAPLHLELPSGEPKNIPAGGQPSIVREASTTTGQTDRVPWVHPTINPAREDRPSKMAPHLKQLMRDVLVSWLTRQRTQLLESHERGTEQVLELHARVEKIRLHFQDRMRAQQQRIAELDSALRSKEKIIVELIRARHPGTGG